MRPLRSISPLAFAVVLLCSAALPAQQEWGSIKGQLVFENGKEVPVETLKVDKDQDHCLSKGDILAEKYVVNPKNRGVRNVVVWIAVDKDGHSNHKAALPIHPDLVAIPANKKKVVVDQPCCKFEPHVVAMRKGQDFICRNSSPVPHSFKTTSQNGVEVNISVAANGGEVEFPADKWRPYHFPTEISCAIHSWMKSYLFVFAHPYFAVTDADGNFEIKNAPAGKFRMIMWHDGAGWVVQEKEEKDAAGKEFRGHDGISITVPAGKTLDLGKVTVPAPKATKS
jgi:hypothetical protein